MNNKAWFKEHFGRFLEHYKDDTLLLPFVEEYHNKIEGIFTRMYPQHGEKEQQKFLHWFKITYTSKMEFALEGIAAVFRKEIETEFALSSEDLAQCLNKK